MYKTYGYALAFARHVADGVDRIVGPVLEATGAFAEEVHNISSDLDAHQVPNTEMEGLLIFEGWVDVGPGEDPDVEWVGEWRRLYHHELVKLRCGERLWHDDEPKEGT